MVPEIFSSKDVQKILCNKFVVIIGSSIQRSMYKDLILLLQQPRLLRQQELRKKGEPSVCGDELVERSELTNKKSYQEVRQFQSKDGFHLIRFYFVTCCYSRYMETILADLSQDPKPDVIIMNSCLWDMTRFGAHSIKEYQVNIQKAVQRFRQILPGECLFIWNTQLPVSKKMRGGFLLPDIAFMAEVLSLDILRANNFAQKVVVDYGFDVVDLHYYFRSQLQHRAADGVHWDEVVHRRITNLLLCHICEAWKLGLPAQRIQPLLPEPVLNCEPDYSDACGRLDNNFNRSSNNPSYMILNSRNCFPEDVDDRYGRGGAEPFYSLPQPVPLIQPAPVPQPVRRHIRSASCDPSYLRNYNIASQCLNPAPTLANNVTNHTLFNNFAQPEHKGFRHFPQPEHTGFRSFPQPQPDRIVFNDFRQPDHVGFNNFCQPQQPRPLMRIDTDDRVRSVDVVNAAQVVVALTTAFQTPTQRVAYTPECSNFPLPRPARTVQLRNCQNSQRRVTWPKYRPY